MKIQEYERAIESLGCRIEIDEMKLKGGRVRQVNGHTETLIVIWDELGRGFSMPAGQDTESFADLDSQQIVAGRRLERDSSFDLKFE